MMNKTKRSIDGDQQTKGSPTDDYQQIMKL